MSDGDPFSSTSARYRLPLLFAGQAQKEVFVNEALSMIDTLLHCTVEGTAAAPPENAKDGDAWIVAEAATGEWAGKDAWLACRQAGNWLYVEPRDGLRVFDRSSGQEQNFQASWRRPQTPMEPSGGSVVDAQARAAIREMVVALRAAAILPSS